jgi:hypothetical protein
MPSSAARKQIHVADEEDDGIIRFSDEPETPRYETLFRADGADYKVLVNPPASLMLSYFDKIRRDGPNLAFSWALEKMVGEDAYKVLLDDPRVSRDTFRQVTDAVLGLLLGRNDETSVPKSSTARRRNGSRPSSG